jgi:hypothetical protein
VTTLGCPACLNSYTYSTSKTSLWRTAAPKTLPGSVPTREASVELVEPFESAIAALRILLRSCRKRAVVFRLFPVSVEAGFHPRVAPVHVNRGTLAGW